MFAASKSGRAAAAAPTSDTLFPYVPLLLNTTSTNGQQNNTFLDSSTNNFTITRNGTPTQGSITPYWPDGYWSNSFNGSSDYLTLPSNSALAFGTGDFTVELWFYKTSTATGAVNDYASANGFGFAIQNNNVITFASGGAAINFAATINLNQWNHVAVVRNSGTLSCYLNGVSIGTPTADSKNYLSPSSLVIGKNAGGSLEYFLGYISNLRMVKGTAVYTSSFTPPTIPLTAITNTSLLTCQSNRFKDGSTNAFVLTPNGTPKAQAFQPFSPTASYTAAAYGGSGYFNGSSDYLTASANSAFAFGTGDFTVELWFYKTATGDGAVNDYASANGFGLVIQNNNVQTFASTQPAINFAATINLNQWNHVAVVRSSGTLSCYLNGASIGTPTADSKNYLSPSSLTIGRNGGGTTQYFPGYMSNLRIVKGTAVYTSAFTPPTAPVTAITNTSLLLNSTNAGIYDAAVQNNVITVGDAQASTTVSKWSPTSIKFDGTGDWLTAIDNPQLQLGTGDFTIDGWVYLSATGVAYGIISKGAASTGWSVNVTSGNKLQFSYTASNLTGATSLAATTWYYFAVVRSGSATGNLKVYLNGSVEATSGGAVTDNFNQTSILYVGADRVGATPLNGYLQDVRITKAARTITTPTAAFPTR
jgi:hypothetical protein